MSQGQTVELEFGGFLIEGSMNKTHINKVGDNDFEQTYNYRDMDVILPSKINATALTGCKLLIFEVQIFEFEKHKDSYFHVDVNMNMIHKRVINIKNEIYEQQNHLAWDGLLTNLGNLDSVHAVVKAGDILGSDKANLDSMAVYKAGLDEICNNLNSKTEKHYNLEAVAPLLTQMKTVEIEKICCKRDSLELYHKQRLHMVCQKIESNRSNSHYPNDFMKPNNLNYAPEPSGFGPSDNLVSNIMEQKDLYNYQPVITEDPVD